MFLCAIGLSQNEAKKWCFGNKAGLDFSTSPPVSFTTEISAPEGSASIADAAGNLLFYTNSTTVWNSSHLVLANSAGMFGDLSSTQGAIIIRKPGSTSLYYIFTLKCCALTPSFHYSIVDMTLASGLGSVTVLNSPIYTGASAEKLTAVRHCNGTDYWVITHDATSNVFRSTLLTAAGVNTTSVLSPVGTSYTGSFGDYVGYMKASPNGRKLAVALTNNFARMELYDFDPSTGVVSNMTTLNNGSAVWYACEFSPDNSKLYATAWNGLYIAQWDLCAGSPTAVVASQYTMSSLTNGGMQLAPDGKIYVGHPNTSTLGVIASPNLGGASCNYNPSSISISPKSNYFGLPNFACNFFLQNPPSVPFTYTLSPAFGCQTASFNCVYVPGTTVTAGCTSVSDPLSGILWNFGDPASGAANTSTLSNPSHQFSTIGSYTTQLVLYFTCHNDTIREVVNVTQPCVTVSSTSITCASLGSATASTTYPGSYTYTWLPVNQTSSVATGLIPGTYTLLVHEANINLTYSITTTLNPLVPFTGNLVSSNSIPCNGVPTGTAQMSNLAGGSGNQNYVWTNGITTFTSPSPNALSAGLWSVTVTDVLTSCAINQVFFISQPSAIVVTVSAVTPSACVNNSISLSGLASGGTPGGGAGYTYSWTTGPAGTTKTVSESSAGSYTYALTATDAAGCQSTGTVALGFVPYPTVTVSSASICPLQTGSLIAAGAGSYTWNTGTTGSTFTDSPSSNTSYFVAGELLGCSSTATAAIVLKPAPSPVFSNNGPVCQGSVLILNAAGGSSYQWQGPGGFAATAASNTINPVPVSAGGIYTVTVTAANACTAAASGTVTVKPLPVIIISPASSSICANTSSVTLTVSGTAASLTWQPNGSLSSGTSATVSAFPPASQVYTITGILNGCTAGTTATVGVVPPPTPVASLSSPSICAQFLNGSPNTVTLTAGGAAVYTISTPSHIFNSNPAGPATGLSSQPPYAPGVETATVYGSNGVCTLSTTTVFTIVPNPTVSIGNPTPVICAGDSYTYTYSGASSYTWNSGTPGQTLYTTGSAAVSHPSITAIFSVLGGSLGCNSATQSTTLTVNPLPVVGIAPNPAVACFASPLTLTATGTGASFQWFPAALVANPQANPATVNANAQQSYTVVASLNSCTAAAAITVSVLPLPAITVTSSSHNVMCLDQSFTLQGAGGYNYTWLYPNHFIALGQTVQVMPTDVSYSGIYTLTATGINGCSNTNTLTMSIEDRPSGYIRSNELSGCVPLSGSYQFISSNFPASEVTVNGWQISNSVSLPPGDHFSYQFVKAGNYFINGTVTTQHGCSNVITLTVTVYPKPLTDFSFTPQNPVENMDRVRFTPLHDQATNGFSWSFINDDPANRSTKQSPEHLFETAGAYPVALIARNQWGCSDSVVKIIVVDPDFSIYIPNTFTPNGDDRNELFLPVLRGVRSLKFMIYNRWDELVYSTESTAGAGWDGSYKGQPCKEDVYVWKLQATGVNNSTKKLTGLVTLYR